MAKDVSGADIIKTVKLARDKDKPKRPSKRFNLIGQRSDKVHGAERIKNWLAGLMVKF